MRRAGIIAAVLVMASGHAHPAFARAAETWYLLVAPAAYDRATHVYSRIGDAPLVTWYRDGEYSSEQECHAFRTAKATEAERLSVAGTDADHFYRAQAWGFRNGRCVSKEELRAPR